MSIFEYMFCNKKNTDNFIPTILFIVVALMFIALTNNEKKNSSFDAYASISLSVENHSNTSAIVPTSISLPICNSFIDVKHIILEYSWVSNYSEKLQLAKEYNSSQAKQLLIKPLLPKVIRLLLFSKNDEGEYATIS